MYKELVSYYRLLGRHEARAGQLLDEYRSIVDPDTLHPWNAAEYYTLRRDNDRAFEFLEKNYKARHWYMTRLMINPAFKPLHDDRAFLDLARRIGVRE